MKGEGGDDCSQGYNGLGWQYDFFSMILYALTTRLFFYFKEFQKIEDNCMFGQIYFEFAWYFYVLVENIVQYR